MTEIPDQVDLLVIGSGAGGMTAALTGALEGLSVLLVEKYDVLGGTSARSAGSIWLPNTHLDPNDGDNFDNALAYLRAAVGNRLDETRAGAFLRAAPEMALRLEEEAGLTLRAYPHHPDYLATLEGATLSGRVLEPEPFDAAILGDKFADIAPPLPEFTLLGGMMVDRTDIGHLLGATKSPKSFMHAAKLVTRYALDRLRHRRGRRLVMGNALVGRLYHALLSKGVSVALNIETTSLIFDKGRVVGAELKQGDKQHTLLATAGVVLATGEFSRNRALRGELFPDHLSEASAVAESATGDGLDLAKPLGGRLSSDHESASFWAPVSHRRRRDGSIGVFPHFVLDRGKPGAFAVGPDGQRFVNEATTYHQWGEALFAMKSRTNGGACHLICDDAFVERYGIGTVRPRRIGLKAALKDGYVAQASSLDAMAAKIGVPAQALVATAERHGRFGKPGSTKTLAKGQTPINKTLATPHTRPTPAFGDLATGRIMRWSFAPEISAPAPVWSATRTLGFLVKMQRRL